MRAQRSIFATSSGRFRRLVIECSLTTSLARISRPSPLELSQQLLSASTVHLFDLRDFPSRWNFLPHSSSPRRPTRASSSTDLNCCGIVVLWSSTIHIVGTERRAVRYIFVVEVTPTSCPVSPSLPAAPPFINNGSCAHALLTRTRPNLPVVDHIPFSFFYSQWNPSRVKRLKISNSCGNGPPGY